MAPRNLKLEDDVSPKSVIAGIRFISPSSSSSSSIDRPHPLLDANFAAKLHQPHHDRGYSISDGASSDPDNIKVWNSRLSIQSIMPISTADDLTGSSSSRRSNIQTGVSSQDAPMQSRRDGENRGTLSTARSLEFGVTNPSFENPGTPLRFFPVWQSQSLGSHVSLRSPGFEKAIIGSLSPGSVADQLHRGIPFQHRFLSGPLHSGISPRPSPSKWDDAEKWIQASPVHHESSAHQPQLLPRPQQLFQTGRRHSIGEHCHPQPICGGGSPDFSTLNMESEKPLSPTCEHIAGRVENQNHRVLASQKKRSKALSFGDVSKRAFDVSCSNASQTTKVCQVPRLEGTAAGSLEKSFDNTGERYNYGAESNKVSEIDARRESRGDVPATQSRECGISEPLEDDNLEATPETARWLDKVFNMDKEILKHALTEPTKETGSHRLQDSSCQAVDRLPPAPVQSWRFERQNLDSSESQQNSTRTTPTFSASPARHNTPAARSDGRHPASFQGSFTKAGLLELQTWHLAKLELCKTLPCDDRNMVWSTREEEDMECYVRLRDHGSGIQLEKECVKAAAWGDAEQTKHDHERYEEEEARINTWVELQTSWAEAEMHKIEMKIEKMRARALEKMTNRIALARKKAKEMRAAAHARRIELAAKAVHQVEQIRIAGRGVAPVPKSPFKGCFRS